MNVTFDQLVRSSRPRRAGHGADRRWLMPVIALSVVCLAAWQLATMPSAAVAPAVPVAAIMPTVHALDPSVPAASTVTFPDVGSPEPASTF